MVIQRIERALKDVSEPQDESEEAQERDLTQNDEERARRESEKLIQEKLKKGYHEVN